MPDVNTGYLTSYSAGIIGGINNLLVPVLMAVAFIFFLWGIYKYFILGAADKKSRTDGRQFALWGITGFVVILSLWGLVNLVMATLGLYATTAPKFQASYTSTNGGNSTGTNGGTELSGMPTAPSGVYPSSTVTYRTTPLQTGQTPSQTGTTGTSSTPPPPAQLTKNPAGIFCLLTGDTVQRPFSLTALNALTSWSNSNIDGVAERSWWNKVEPTQGVRDWSFIDEVVNTAKEKNKKISINIMAGINTPDWVYASGVPKFPVTFQGQSLTLPLLWDQKYLDLWGSLIQEAGERYDGDSSISYVHIAGIGPTAETYFVKSASEVAAMNALGGINKWIEGAEKIIDIYASAFPTTPIIIALSPPTIGADGDRAMKTVIEYGVSHYPGHFGIANHGLNATSNTGYLANKLISDHSSDSPVGFQMVWSTVGTNASLIQGTLAEALETANTLKAHFVEVYVVDCDNTSYASTLKHYGSIYKANAGVP